VQVRRPLARRGRRMMHRMGDLYSSSYFIHSVRESSPKGDGGVWCAGAPGAPWDPDLAGHRRRVGLVAGAVHRVQQRGDTAASTEGTRSYGQPAAKGRFFG